MRICLVLEGSYPPYVHGGGFYLDAALLRGYA